MYFQDPSSKGFALSLVLKGVTGLGKVHFYLWWGCLICLFVCLFLKQNYDSLPSPLSNLEPFVFRSPKFNSENKTLLYKLPLQGWNTDCLRVMLETLKSKLGLCLHCSTPFVSLDFSSSLLGDPSLIPKRSILHSSRIAADYVSLHAKKETNKHTTQSKNEKDC